MSLAHVDIRGSCESSWILEDGNGDRANGPVSIPLIAERAGFDLEARELLMHRILEGSRPASKEARDSELDGASRLQRVAVTVEGEEIHKALVPFGSLALEH